LEGWPKFPPAKKPENKEKFYGHPFTKGKPEKLRGWKGAFHDWAKYGKTQCARNSSSFS